MSTRSYHDLDDFYPMVFSLAVSALVISWRLAWMYRTERAILALLQDERHARLAARDTDPVAHPAASHSAARSREASHESPTGQAR